MFVQSAYSLERAEVLLRFAHLVAASHKAGALHRASVNLTKEHILLSSLLLMDVSRREHNLWVEKLVRLSWERAEPSDYSGYYRLTGEMRLAGVFREDDLDLMPRIDGELCLRTSKLQTNPVLAIPTSAGPVFVEVLEHAVISGLKQRNHTGSRELARRRDVLTS